MALDREWQKRLAREAKRSAPAREAKRLAELRAELAELKAALQKIGDEPERARAMHAANEIGKAVDVIVWCMSPHSPLPDKVLGVAGEAVSVLWAVESTRAVGRDPFGLYLVSAGRLGAATAYAVEAFTRREAASPRHAASRQLRGLVAEFPDKTAAELRRILESRTGGRMDDSAARAVVRRARKAPDSQG